MDTNLFKEKLLVEKETLEVELATVGHKNPNRPADWQATESDLNTDPADEDEVADAMENFETNSAIVHELNTRLLDVTTALEKIEKGTYGTCEVGGESIEEDRLNANPAAKTCKKHMNG